MAGAGPLLFGLNWLEQIKLDWGTIQTVRTDLDQPLQSHEQVFRKELGTPKGVQAHLEVDTEARPKFYKPRSVPYAVKGSIEQDLKKLERLGIIEVKYSDWAAPINPVTKAAGIIRICRDYKVTVNSILKVDQYPCLLQNTCSLL